MEGLPSAEMSETHNNKAVLAYPAAPQVNAQSFLQLALYPITLKVSPFTICLFYYVLPARLILVLNFDPFYNVFLSLSENIVLDFYY